MALLVLPIACGVFAAQQLREQQPHWGGQMADPSYIYLLSALNLATFSPPGHVDHPGTPVQVIGALTLRALHPQLSSARLAEAVLSDPESHARTISIVLIAIAVVSSLSAGIWLWHRTGRLDAALFSQLGPLLIPSVLPGYSGVRPEPLLIASAHLWVAALLAWSCGALDLRKRTWITVLATIGGCAVAAKYTFLPLLLIPLALLEGWRTRLIFLLTAFVTFVVAILPAILQLRRIASWVLRLAIHEGAYGSGKVGLAPAQGWANAIKATLWGNMELALLLTACALLLMLAWQRQASNPASPRHWRLGAATVAASFVAILATAKQGNGTSRYLIPVAACAPIALYTVWRCHSPQLPIRVHRATIIAFAPIVAASFLSAWTSQISVVRADRADAAAARAWIAHHLPNATVVPYYGVSSLPFALAQADLYAMRWAPTLARLYPDFFCFELWSAQFKHNFSPIPSGPPAGEFYLAGVPLEGGVLADAKHALPLQLTLIWANRVEAVYRAQPTRSAGPL